MTPGAECVGENETLLDAAGKMRDLDVGPLPICGDDNRLKGVLTDRDIVVRCLADGGDPARPAPVNSDRASRSRSAPTTRSRRHCAPCPNTRSGVCR
jgi:CBS domain-containing protein